MLLLKPLGDDRYAHAAAEQIERGEQHTHVGFHAGEDHGRGVELAQAFGEAGGAAGGERGLLERRRVVQEHAQFGQRVAEPLWILLGDDDGGAEAPRGREQDLQITNHLVAPLGIHRAEQTLLHVGDDEDGLWHRRTLRSGDCRVLCHDVFRRGGLLPSVAQAASAPAEPPRSLLIRLAMAATRSAGSSGLATCIWNPAASARVRSSARA